MDWNFLRGETDKITKENIRKFFLGKYVKYGNSYDHIVKIEIFSDSLDVVENCEFDYAYLYEGGEWKEFNSDPVKGYYNLRKLLGRMEYRKIRDIMLKAFLFKGIDTNGKEHTAIVAARNKEEAYETLKNTSTITPFPYSNKAIYVDELFCHRLYADLIHED